MKKYLLVYLFIGWFYFLFLPALTNLEVVGGRVEEREKAEDMEGAKQKW